MRLLLRIVFWQAGWFGAVGGAAAGWWWSGLAMAPCVALAPRGRVLRIALVTAAGLGVDAALVLAGAFLPGAGWGPLTAWMPALWAGLAASTDLLPRWLRATWALALAGALSGPAAYAGGMAWGALAPGALGQVAGLTLVAAAWTIALPFTVRVMEGPRS
jgi:hypothetical protein